MLKSIEEVYYIIDEIVQPCIEKKSKIGRPGKLSKSEIMTILIEGHKKGYSTEKQFYDYANGELKRYFHTPDYAQFTRAIRKAEPYLDLVLAVLTQINAENKQCFCIVDSTSLPVSGYNKKDVKWASKSAGKGKNMHGFYQGFKLHIIINQNREIISVSTSKANVHDVQLLKDHSFIQHVKGILVGDKGYIASEDHRNSLLKIGIKLIAKQRENMDPYLNQYFAPFLKKRRKIESIFGDLKTRFSLMLPFLRSPESFLAHVKAAVIAYMFRKFELEKLYI